ncbi:MAG: alkaline phosphatase family protein [Fuerstiella sp.]|nr:alkaline phosphatase family protein [Fuerstiella sp.]MCP4506470.1 alkaline phosphatase family protein [Fuerstiella sp.]
MTQHNAELILLHLITPDGVEHGYGSDTPVDYQAVVESDQRLGEIRDALQQSPFAGNAIMFVVFDHGFAACAKLLQPNVVWKQRGLIKTDETNKVTERRTEITAVLADKPAGMHGVLGVKSSGEFTQLGGQNPEAPHLVLITGPGYSFDNCVKGKAVADAGGHKGSHGHDPRPDSMYATFVAVEKGNQTRHKT